MDREQKTAEVSRILEVALDAASDAGDDWPYEVARHAVPLLSKHLACAFTRTDLVRLLAEVDDERIATGASTDRARFLAETLVERFVPEEGEHLSLYYFPSCPFCVRVMRVIDELGIDVELRDIHRNPEYRRELLEARGRRTVPVLRCTSSVGERWMPESADIVRALRARYGSSAKPSSS
jgi:glutaredoxin